MPIFSLLVIFFSIAPSVSAETSVNISNNGAHAKSDVNVRTETGNNTICIDGKCTTSSGKVNGTNTVCINGKCQTSDGNIDVESDDGNSKVHINNGGSSVNVDQETEENAENKIEIEQVGPTIGSTKKNDIKKQDKIVKKIKSEFDIREFVREKMLYLRTLITFQFLFGNK